MVYHQSSPLISWAPSAARGVFSDRSLVGKSASVKNQKYIISHQLQHLFILY